VICTTNSPHLRGCSRGKGLFGTIARGWAAASGPMAHGAVLGMLLMLVVPGGALQEDMRPRATAAPAAFAGGVPVLPPAAAGTGNTAQPHLCGLTSHSQFRLGDRKPAVSGRVSRLPVPIAEGRLELRRGFSPRPLSMAEEQSTSPLSKEEKKIIAKAEQEELNTKLWDAAESGDAALIRKLVQDGAEVNSAPYVPDEDEDDDDAMFSALPVTELSQESWSEVSIPADSAMSDKPTETPEERQKRKAKEKKRKRKLAAANKVSAWPRPSLRYSKALTQVAL